MAEHDDDTLWLSCPACKSRVAYRPGSGLSTTRCTGCGQPIGLLDETEVATPFKTRGAMADEDFLPSTIDDEYQMSAWIEPVRAKSEPIVSIPVDIPPDPKAAIRVRPNPPPRPLFVAGVFFFPWQQRSLVPWLVISIGSMMFGMVSVLAVGGVLSATIQGGLVAGGALMALIWIALLALSYAAACLFSVVDMTSYNFELDEDWPEPDWRERCWHLVWVVWLLFVSAVPGLLVSYVTGLPWTATFIYQIGAIAILFPILLLSSLEADSMFLPLSGPIARSLISEGLTWLGFYAITLSLLAVWLFLTLRGFLESPYRSIVISAPIFGALVLIYGRLVGRLAWKIMRPGELELQAWRRAHDRQTSQENPAAREAPVPKQRGRGEGE